jgi:carboxylate-amine ligase
VPGGFTLGVEEEFSIVDRATGELRPAAEVVVPLARDVLGDQAEPELNRSQVETGTGVCGTLAEVRAELVRLRRGLLDAAEAAGAAVVSTGTHPTASWRDQGVNPTKSRYRRLERDFQQVAREQLVSGCHVHVGVAGRELAIEVVDRSRPWLSTVAALAANSPFWEGVDTGYASYRTQVWSMWPLTGVPEPLGSRAAYDRLVADLAATDGAPDATYLYWDVRPSARFETVEFRATDACLTIDDAVLVAGLWRALARTCATEAEEGLPPPRVRGELVDAARWRAARFGLDATLADLGRRRAAPAREVVDGLLAHLRPALEKEGDWDEVSALADRTFADGNGASRQRAAFARRGDIGDVVRLLVTETAAGIG